jgi:hypothetical protein
LELFFKDSNFDFITNHDNKFSKIKELETYFTDTLKLLNNIPNENTNDYMLNEIMYNYTDFINGIPNKKKEAHFYTVKSFLIFLLSYLILFILISFIIVMDEK